MKASFANMKLKLDTSVQSFDFKGQKIEVLRYLPTQDKYDLLMVTLQKAFENGIYNEFKLNVFFELHLVYMYTNISFTEKQREDELKIYDLLKSNGFFDKFFAVFNEKEYNELFEQLNEIKKSMITNQNSIGYIVSRFIDDMPINAEAAAKIVDSFNPEKFKEVINFANYANGGRDFRTMYPNAIEEPSGEV